MKLYLIRHGQTDWNIAGKIQGRTDIPLNAAGRAQAEDLAAGMAHRPVSRIFTSGMKRALETAQAVAKAQNIEAQPIEGLEEIGFGAWEGLTWKEVKERYPETYQHWWLNPIDVAPPDGELQDEVRQRCSRVIRKIVAQAEGDAAIVTHGAMMAYLMEYLMREHPMEEEIIVENASITTIDYSPLTQDVVLLQMNDTTHLRY
ncbi:MAG: histidine phosphatase family protein [Hungatella sp.]